MNVGLDVVAGGQGGRLRVEALRATLIGLESAIA